MSNPRKNGHAPAANGAAAIEAPGLAGLEARSAVDPKRNGGNGSAVRNANGAAKAEPKNGAETEKPKRRLYDCSKCPGYCCSYPVITVTKYDLVRLARHFGITPEEAEKRFTKSQHGYKRILRRKKDEHFGKICRFFDQEKRRCGIYPARPHVCRSFPGDGRCGYWDFLSFERRTQNDPEFVSLTNHTQ